MGPIRNPNWSTSGMRVTLLYLVVVIHVGSEKWNFQPIRKHNWPSSNFEFLKVRNNVEEQL